MHAAFLSLREEPVPGCDATSTRWGARTKRTAAVLFLRSRFNPESRATFRSYLQPAALGAPDLLLLLSIMRKETHAWWGETEKRARLGRVSPRASSSEATSDLVFAALRSVSSFPFYARRNVNSSRRGEWRFLCRSSCCCVFDQPRLTASPHENMHTSPLPSLGASFSLLGISQ